jgi:hypothetical protein
MEGGRAEEWKRELLHGLFEEFDRQAHSPDLGQKLFGEEAAKGVSLAESLGRTYDVVSTNPPYVSSGNLNARIRMFLDAEYKDGKRDLYAAFIQRCRDFAVRGGHIGMLTQQSWLFLRSFATLRKQVLEQVALTTLAHLGPRAFEEIGGEVVNIAMFTLRKEPPFVEQRVAAFRLIGPKSAVDKDRLLRRLIVARTPDMLSTPIQADFLAIPETPIVYWLRPRFFQLLQSTRRLSGIANVKEGLGTRDDARFMRYFWEAHGQGPPSGGGTGKGRWHWCVKGGRYQKWAGLEYYVVDWGDDGRAIKNWPGIDFAQGVAPTTSKKAVLSHVLHADAWELGVSLNPYLQIPLLLCLSLIKRVNSNSRSSLY